MDRTWKTMTATIESTSMFSRDVSRSTSTRSTMTCVKTGRTICSAATTSPSPSAWSRMRWNGRKNGRSHARFDRVTGADSNASV